MKTTILDNELQQELEHLFINNPELNAITNYLYRFNPIKVMGAQGSELRHSKILGWLLDPKANHGLEDRFLKSFLARAMQGAGAPPNSLFILVRGLTEANVYLEWNNIDIFIEVPHEKNPWCFVIENKVNSTQRQKQLTDYRKLVEDRFGQYSIGYIFLTLNEEEPEDDKYRQIFYADIAGILADILEESRDKLSSKIYNFINYYCETIMELSDMSDQHENIKKLARKLYSEHRRALDFIQEHASGTEFEYGMLEFFDQERDAVDDGFEFQAQGVDYTLTAVSSAWFNFVAKSWQQKLTGLLPAGVDMWPGSESWKASGLPIKAWVEMEEKSKPESVEYNLKMITAIGPMDDTDARELLVECMDNATKGHHKISISSKSRKYTRFLTLVEKVESPYDVSGIAQKIQKLFTNFSEYVPSINEGVDDFCRKLGDSQIGND